MKYQFREIYTRSSLNDRWQTPCGDHIENPWKILKIDDKPEWWETEYGSGPYTLENQCWQDIKEGKVAGGDKQGTYNELSQPYILGAVREWDVIRILQNDGTILSFTEHGYDSLVYTVTWLFDSKFSFDFYTREVSRMHNNSTQWTDEEINKHLSQYNIVRQSEEEYLLD